MNELKTLIAAASTLHAGPTPYLSATVVRVLGSAYRKPGARMLATQERWAAGSISAGCLERDVLNRGMWRLRDGLPVLVRYDASEDALDEWQGSGCQGVIDVLLEPGASHAYAAYAFAARCLETETAGVIATVFASEHAAIQVGMKLLISPDAVAGTLEDSALRAWLTTESREGGPARVVTRDGVTALIEPVVLPPHLFIFGGNHDVGPLATLARNLGWSISLWDGQTRTRAENFGDYLTGSAEAAVQRLNACARPIAVVMTHDLQRDQEVLSALLPSRAQYIGVLGPRRRTEQLLARCVRPGVGQLSGRLFGPAGLAIGSESPAEIALSIVAQVQSVLTAATDQAQRAFARASGY